MTVFALVGPRPVYLCSSCTVEVEILALGASSGVCLPIGNPSVRFLGGV